MTTENLSSIAENIFGKKQEIKTSSNVKADSDLIITRKDRGHAWTRFLVTQSGGYDPQYYTKQEAKSTTVLAAAKFVSVSLATYAFMKAISPALKNESLTTLPTIANTDPRFIITGGVAAGLWWGVSKLDTSVMHSMRAKKTAEYVAQHLGINNADKKHNIWGPLFRYSISLGSLGITIPALLVTTSENTIDQYILAKQNLKNAPIIQEYQEQLNQTDKYIGNLQSNLITYQSSLDQIRKTGALVTDNQKNYIQQLNKETQRLEQERIDKETELLEQKKIRDSAESRIRQELDGARGSFAGKGPNYKNAVQDRDDASRRMTTIQQALSKIENQLYNKESKLEKINKEISETGTKRHDEVTAQRETLETQIKTIKDQLAIQIALRKKVADVTDKAKKDPRYTHFNPDLSNQFNAYVDYMSEEAHPLEWSRAGFMALIIISLELGVFALASSRRVNPGEVRGYLADIAKSEEAADLYHKILEKRETEKQNDVINSIDTIKKRKILEAEMTIFEDGLNEIKNNPEYREQALNDVMHVWESMRMKVNDNSPSIKERKQKTQHTSPSNTYEI